MTIRATSPDVRRRTTWIVGLGSSHGDDRVGWIVAQRLADSLNGDAQVRAAATPVALLDWLAPQQRLIVCDACRGTGAPGSVTRWQWPTDALPTLRSSSSHHLGLPDVLELASHLDRLPLEVIIYGIEAADVGPGEDLSPAVAAALDDVVAAVGREVHGA